MIKRKYFYMTLISFLFFNISCGLYEAVKNATDNQKNCFDNGTTYNSEFQQSGIYRDYKEREYRVLVDYESIDDANTFYQKTTAKDIAELASFAIKALEESKTPKYKFVAGAYYDGLKSIHVIVTNTQEEFEYLSSKGDKLESNIIAYTFEEIFCWDHEKDVNFDIVIKNEYMKNINVLTHEITHNIAYHLFGDGDGDHNNPAVWYDVGGADSIQGKILWQYELETGVNVIAGGPVTP